MKTYDDYSQEERQAMSRADRAKLRALQKEKFIRPMIEAASPGPWYRTHGCIASGPTMLALVERNERLHLGGTEADARLMAAACPKKMGELLDLIGILLKQREAARVALEKISTETEWGEFSDVPTRASKVAKEALDRIVEWPAP